MLPYAQYFILPRIHCSAKVIVPRMLSWLAEKSSPPGLGEPLDRLLPCRLPATLLCMCTQQVTLKASSHNKWVIKT